jgi:hypothetical protein
VHCAAAAGCGVLSGVGGGLVSVGVGSWPPLHAENNTKPKNKKRYREFFFIKLPGKTGHFSLEF